MTAPQIRARVEARIHDQRLVELTNPKGVGATTVDTTLLEDAADDVLGDFRIFANVVYDDTDNRHVSAAIMGVLFKLLVYKGTSKSEDKHGTWQKGLDKWLRFVTHNDRIRPKSTSRLSPAVENPSGAPMRPFFDPEVGFGSLIPSLRDADTPVDSDAGRRLC